MVNWAFNQKVYKSIDTLMQILYNNDVKNY